jgi:TolA-binding protein
MRRLALTLALGGLLGWGTAWAQDDAPPPDQPTDATVDGGPPVVEPASPQSAQELDDLHNQLQSQQAEIQQLQQQVGERDQEIEEMGQVVDQLQGLRDQVAAGQEHEQAVEAQRAASEQNLSASLDTLRQADDLLVTGATSGVDDALQEVSQTLTGQSRVYAANAQDALDNGDVYNARVFLELAIATANANQVSGTGQPVAQP